MKHDAYMSRRQQLILTFEQETGKKFDDINGLCCRSYTEWLEDRLSTIVQQSLSGSEAKASTPKSCGNCGRLPIIGKDYCAVCDDDEKNNWIPHDF